MGPVAGASLGGKKVQQYPKNPYFVIMSTRIVLRLVDASFRIIYQKIDHEEWNKVAYSKYCILSTCWISIVQYR